METSGGTAQIAGWIADISSGFSPVVVLTILMIITMTLSDIMNNTATAVIAAPIAVDIANRLQVNPDPFLCFSHSHRAQKQHPDHGPRRIPFWGLLAHGIAAGNTGGPGLDTGNFMGMAPIAVNPATPKTGLFLTAAGDIMLLFGCLGITNYRDRHFDIYCRG